MEVLDRIIGEIKEAFKYWKNRDKSKYYGDRFEEWVVKNSNISKDGCAESCKGKPFWRLLEWRGDKYIDGYRPISSSAPDLLMECICGANRNYEEGEVIAVECKWKSNLQGFYLELKDIRKYEEYIRANQSRYPIKSLFYVFGSGWSCDSPEMVYVIPACELYDYNTDSTITFKLKGSNEERMKQLENYKRAPESKYLMYWRKK